MTTIRRLSKSNMRMTTLAICCLLVLIDRASCLQGSSHPHHHHHPHSHTHIPHHQNQQNQESSSNQQQQQQHHGSDENDPLANNNNSNRIRVLLAPHDHRPVKYCADLSPLQEFLTTQIEPYYTPLIGLLPENLQLVLLDHTSFGGFTTASCLLVATGLVCALLAWFAAARFMHTSAENTSARLNEQLLALKLALNHANVKSNTFEHEIIDLQSRLKESESKLVQANERIESIASTSSGLSAREAEKLQQNEMRAAKEVRELKLELAETRNKFELEKREYEAQVAAELSEQLSRANEEAMARSQQLVTELRHENEKLREELASKQQQQQHQQISAASRCDVPASQSMDEEETVVKGGDLSDLMVKLIKMEQRLGASEKEASAQTSVCAQLRDALTSSEEKKRDLEKHLKEAEIQIKILNDLREKDTQRHVKSMAELDNQLKKKSNEAEKSSLLLDQMRVKQERIQELEQQFGKIERQSNAERQAHEKQAHETWLQMRKIERELKDVRAELASARDRLVESESSLKTAHGENQALKQTLVKLQTTTTTNNYHQFISSPTASAGRRSAGASESSHEQHFNGTTNDLSTPGAPLTDELQVDTVNGHSNGQASSSRPSSTASSCSGGGGAKIQNGATNNHHQPSPSNHVPHNKYAPAPSPGSSSLAAPGAPTQTPFPMIYPSQAAMNANGGLMPPPPSMVAGGAIPFQSPQHIMMMKMMMQQQQQNYQKHLANMAAMATAAAASAATTAHNGTSKISPSPNGHYSLSPHHPHHAMSYSATFPNGNASVSFLNDSSSMGNMNSSSSPRGSSAAEKEEEMSSSSKAGNDDGANSSNQSVAPTNLAATFEV